MLALLGQPFEDRLMRKLWICHTVGVSILSFFAVVLDQLLDFPLPASPHGHRPAEGGQRAQVNGSCDHPLHEHRCAVREVQRGVNGILAQCELQDDALHRAQTVQSQGRVPVRERLFHHELKIIADNLLNAGEKASQFRGREGVRHFAFHAPVPAAEGAAPTAHELEAVVAHDTLEARWPQRLQGRCLVELGKCAVIDVHVDDNEVGTEEQSAEGRPEPLVHDTEPLAHIPEQHQRGAEEEGQARSPRWQRFAARPKQRPVLQRKGQRQHAAATTDEGARVAEERPEAPSGGHGQLHGCWRQVPYTWLDWQLSSPPDKRSGTWTNWHCGGAV
mmetsp:Transcript_74132/g.191220  ORF Transcript_74132/g.191220 Transcript_74132/m.191220 type:complete len:332 (-) Transcript_74132:50-1045(-)